MTEPKIPSQDDIVTQKANEIVDGGDLTVLPPVQSPSEQILSAISHGADMKKLEVLERAFEFDLRVKAKQAEGLFFKAFARFKQEDFKVVTDQINKAFEGRRFPSVGHFLGIVNPYLGKHELSANFRIEDSEDYKFIKVTAVITHSSGHSIESGMSAEPDTKGPKGGDVKTELHGRLSTVTHLMRGTFSAVTGIGAVDPGHDEGGTAGIKPDEFINKDQQKEITKKLKAIYGEDPSMFFNWVGAETVDTIKIDWLERVMGALKKAEKAKAELEAQEKDTAKEGREPGCDDQ